MAITSVRLIGDDDLRRKLDARRLAGEPARRLLTRSAIAVQGKSRERASVDRGEWRSSIAYEVDPSPFPNEARVGSNTPHGYYANFGREPGKWPPPGALLGWMQRHGIPASQEYVIRRAIGRSGTKGDHALDDGLDAAKPQIRVFVVQMAREIEAEAGR